MKVLSIVGARPQFIKAAPVSTARRAAGLHEVLVHTGQHYDREMSQLFFDEMGIPAPDHNLGIGSGSHASHEGPPMAASPWVRLPTHNSRGRGEYAVLGQTTQRPSSSNRILRNARPVTHPRCMRRACPGGRERDGQWFATPSIGFG